MAEEISINAIKEACCVGYNIMDKDCDILISERGPSINCLSDINTNHVLYCRFVERQLEQLIEEMNL